MNQPGKADKGNKTGKGTPASTKACIAGAQATTRPLRRAVSAEEFQQATAATLGRIQTTISPFTPQPAAPLPPNLTLNLPPNKRSITNDPAKMADRVPEKPERAAKKETIEDIRANMAKLLEPGVQTDEEFAAFHLGGNEPALIKKAMEEEMKKRAAKGKGNANTNPTKSTTGPSAGMQKFLEQRADSRGYAERHGEAVPSYVIKQATIDKMKKMAEMIKASAGAGGMTGGSARGMAGGAAVGTAGGTSAAAAGGTASGPGPAEKKVEKVMNAIEARLAELSKEYDETYERNLHEMEHGPNCHCNKGNWPVDPPNPTNTVTGRKKPAAKKKGLAGPSAKAGPSANAGPAANAGQSANIGSSFTVGPSANAADESK